MGMVKIAIPIVAVIAVLILFFVSNTNNDHAPQIDTKSTERPANPPKENKYIKEYGLTAKTAPNAILPDGDFVWVVGAKLIKFDANAEKISKTYDLGQQENLMAWSMTKDSDGYIWFARLGEQKIWRFDPASEQFFTYPTNHSIFSMKSDRNTGQIWFSTLAGSTVGVVQKAGNGYKISEFAVGTNATVSGLTVHDNSLLVSVLSTENSTGNISEFSINRGPDQTVTGITKTGQIPYQVYDPTDVIVLNNTVWFTEHGSGLFAKYDMDSGKLIRYHTSENKFHTSTLPLWLRPAGNGFWFNEHGGNRIGFFDVAKDTLTEYVIPSVPDGGIVVYPLNIYTDPNNQDRAWFSEWNADKIAVVNGSVQVPFEIEVASSDNKGNIKITNVDSDQSLSVNGTSSQGERISVMFSNSTVNLKAGQTVSVDFAATSARPQNATLTISATDGIVTKSAFAKFSSR